MQIPNAYKEKKILGELSRLRCQMDKFACQRTFYLLSKVAKHIFEGVLIEQDGLDMVKELSKDRKTRVVMMPVYKSYADPLVLYYINYMKNFDFGFIFGHLEDSPKVLAVENLLKNIGCFLVKRN